jgi:VIT1/CCC1 family predicted Fe2+/Mn2+ transporter
VLILGVANLVGDGFSMAAGDFSATRAERDEHARLRRMEERHVDLVPEGEREEVREIYRGKGFRGEDLERAVGVVTASREGWIDAMMAEEHGQPKALRLPWRAALGTFGSFLVCGSIPLLPFVAGADEASGLSLAATALVFFGIGAAKSRWSVAGWWRSGLETLAVGLAAAGLAFAIGQGLKGLV